jgi:hypothetical protein
LVVVVIVVDIFYILYLCHPSTKYSSSFWDGWKPSTTVFRERVEGESLIGVSVG